MVGTLRTPISCVFVRAALLLLCAASVSGAQPNDDNARYLLPLTEAWTTPLPAPAAAAAALDGAHVYVPLVDGRVLALARETGAVSWVAPAGAVTTPLPSGDLLLVPTGTGITALETASGAPRWTRAVEGAPLAPLAAVSGLAAGMSADGRITTVDVGTGAVVWSRDLGYGVSSRLLAAGDARLHAAFEDRMVGLAADDGRLLWERRIPGPFTPPAVGDGRLAVGAGDRQLFALDATSGALAWRWRAGGDVVGSVVGAEGVYFAALDNRLRAVARGSGNQRWQRALTTRPAHPPQLVGSVVLVTGVAPEILAFDAATGAPRGTYTAPAELRGPLLIDPRPRPYEVAAAIVTRTDLAIGLRPTQLQLAEPALAPLGALPGRALPLP